MDAPGQDRGVESLRRCGAEHERMSALSFKQVIAGSAPACATKFLPRMLVGQRAVSKAALPRSNRGRGAIGAKLIRMSMRLLIAR